MYRPTSLLALVLSLACGRTPDKVDTASHGAPMVPPDSSPITGNAPGSKADLIQVSQPLPNTLIRSPLRVLGQARGSWFFEASFPVLLLDDKGDTLAATPARAEGEWMTEDFVPFEVILEFTPPAGSGGTLILRKDNPSGLPERADERRIPVRFH